jgi:hypothetical protein
VDTRALGLGTDTCQFLRFVSAHASERFVSTGAHATLRVQFSAWFDPKVPEI